MEDNEVMAKAPAKRTIRLTAGEKWLVFTAAVGVWLSGLLWVIFQYFMQVEHEFGLQQHPLEPLWQKLHGGLGFVATFALGMLWGMHVVKGWKMRWRRLSGGWLFGVSLFLIVSGGALYYIDADTWRSWTGIAHWAIGIAVLLLFFLHWLSRSLPNKRR